MHLEARGSSAVGELDKQAFTQKLQCPQKCTQLDAGMMGRRPVNGYFWCQPTFLSLDIRKE